jgi:N utilization substance protein B
LEAVQQFPGYVQVLPADFEEESLEVLPPAVINQGFYQELLAMFFDHAALVDQTLAIFVDRPFPDIDPMEKSLLRLGATELLYFHQTPPQVILNEAIEIAKIFASSDSYKYINGILDKLANRCRRTSPPSS